MRYMFGLTGNAMTNGVIASGAPRGDAARLHVYLDLLRPRFDIDGNGDVNALSDGLLILRYLFGLRGTALIAGAVGPLAQRTSTFSIEEYIRSLMQ